MHDQFVRFAVVLAPLLDDFVAAQNGLEHEQLVWAVCDSTWGSRLQGSCLQECFARAWFVADHLLKAPAYAIMLKVNVVRTLLFQSGSHVWPWTGNENQQIKMH